MLKTVKDPLLILLTGIILTVIFTWPFTTKLQNFYYDNGDYAVSGSIMWYIQDSIKTGNILNQKEFLNGYQFYPLPFTFVFTDHTFFPSIFIFTPFYLLTQNLAFSVNILTFLTFVLSFITSYYTINFFVKNKLASLIGGIIFTFNPLSFAHFPQHLNLPNKYFLPLVFLFAFKFLQKTNLKNAFLFSLFFSLNALSVVYYQIFTLVLLPLFSLPFLISNLKSLEHFLKYIGKLLKYGLVFLIFVPFLLYAALPYLEFSKKENAQRTIVQNVYYSARLIDWFSPAPESFLYSNLVKMLDPHRSPKDSNTGIFNYEEHTLFPNILPVLLVLLSFFYFYKRSKTENRLMFYSFSILLVSTFVLTFGPYFQGWNGRDSTDIKLPFYYLYEFLPFFKGIRVSTRFQYLFYIPFSLFASYGAYYLFQKLKNKRLIYIFFFVFVIFLFLENYNAKSYSNESLMLQKLKQINSGENRFKFLERKATLHLPVYTPDFGKDSIYLNWATVTKEKVMNANDAYYPADQLNFLYNLKNKIDEATLKKLYAINVDYIILHKGLLGKDIEKYKTITESQNQTVYDKDNIQIIDLKKYNFEIKKCDFNKDIEKDLKNATLENSNQNIRVFILKNKSNCYLSNVYMDRYRNVSYNTGDFYGNPQKRTIYLRLPVVIEPYQEVVLYEIYNDFRIE